MKRLFLFFLLLTSGWAQTLCAQSGLEAFGIFSPVMGLQESIPSVTLPEAFTPDNENVILKYGEIHRAKLRGGQFLVAGSPTAVPDGNPILRYHYLEQTGGTSYLLAFTKAHTYRWNAAGTAWVTMFTCASNCDAWSTTTFNDVMYATNNVDKPQWWQGSWDCFRNMDEAAKYSTGTVSIDNSTATLIGSGTNWDPCAAAGDIVYLAGDDTGIAIQTVSSDTSIALAANYTGGNLSGASYTIYDNVGVKVGTSTYITRARFLTDFEGYVLLGNVLVGGTTYPTTLYWSDTQDGDNWLTGNSGSVALPGPDQLLGAGKIADFLLVFSGRSIDQLWATDSSLIFNARRLRNNMGSYSPDSIVNGANGELFFLDNQRNIRAIQSVMSDMAIVSRPIDKTTKNIPDALVSGVRGVWLPSLEQLWWAIPYGTSATANSKILCLDATSGAWTKLGVAAAAFGNYEEQTGAAAYTWQTLPYATWEKWDWEQWDTVEALIEAKLDLCGDYSGYSFNSHTAETDNGSAYTGYAVLGTSFAQPNASPAVDRYKRLAFITVFFRNEGTGTADIALKRDYEGNWQSLGSVSLASGGDIVSTKIPVPNYRAKHFDLKVSGTNPFRFIGCIFYYVSESLR